MCGSIHVCFWLMFICLNCWDHKSDNYQKGLFHSLFQFDRDKEKEKSDRKIESSNEAIEAKIIELHGKQLIYSTWIWRCFETDIIDKIPIKFEPTKYSIHAHVYMIFCCTNDHIRIYCSLHPCIYSTYSMIEPSKTNVFKCEEFKFSVYI